MGITRIFGRLPWPGRRLREQVRALDADLEFAYKRNVDLAILNSMLNKDCQHVVDQNDELKARIADLKAALRDLLAASGNIGCALRATYRDMPGFPPYLIRELDKAKDRASEAYLEPTKEAPV